MEGAAFGLAMSRYPQIPWLVVKGVGDYADPAKNEIYYDYAAHASALYALSFIQAYVTNERLLRSSVEKSFGIWNVPHPRNLYFTGREALLQNLHETLNTDNIATLTYVPNARQAIRGLVGIGKTQPAIEYADHYSHDY